MRIGTSRLFTAVAIMAGTLVSAASHAAGISISSMDITGGELRLYQSDGFSTVHPFLSMGPDTNLVGGYIGNGGVGRVENDPDPDSIVQLTVVTCGDFPVACPVNVYTAASNLGDTKIDPGTIFGGPVPSGTLDAAAGSIIMDLSAWFINWNNEDIHNGTGKSDGITSALATGTWDAATGAYTLSWQSVALCNFSGCTVGEWTLTGSATPVPLPMPFWLLLAGLAALGRVAVRSRH